jgi:hypothetical protein
MNSGSVLVEWDAAGHLNIKTSLNMNDSAGKKTAIEKLLDAARAINNQGTSLTIPGGNSTRLFSGTG